MAPFHLQRCSSYLGQIETGWMDLIRTGASLGAQSRGQAIGSSFSVELCRRKKRLNNPHFCVTLCCTLMLRVNFLGFLFLLANNTNWAYIVLSRTISKLWLIIGQIFASDREHFTLTPSLGWSPANIRINFTSSEIRVIVLPDTENCMIVCLFFLTKHRNVTDGQTDRWTDAIVITALCIASSADAL